MNSPKPIQIFKPGRHTAMSGAVLDFTEADVVASAAAYDPAKFEAPLVVGHPKTDAPAYGWVKSVGVDGGVLFAQPDQVDPAFAEIVAAGRYKKISASFYAPNAPGNPVPGVYYLKHVGFLGAAAPAVKGLRNAEFAAAEEGVVEFADWGDVQNASLWRRLRDWMIGEKGLAIADSIIPDYAVSSLEDEARKETPGDSASATPAPAFVEPNHQENNTVKPEEAAALTAENAQLKQQAAEFAAREKAAKLAAVHAGNASFAEALVKAGKLLPAQSGVCVATLDFFAGQEAVVEFGEGDAKKPIGDAFKAFLQTLPKQVEFGEFAGGGKIADGDDAGAISRAAVEFQESEAQAGRIINIAQAVEHVTRKAG
ncbi:MAG: hypothetical protein PHY45_11720 [Rhodocyclaceae bacterium]|nr:hypothetical protein [Rhodocyclaceae bacterium]